MLKYNAHLKDTGRRLRRNLTDSEAALWSRWRTKQLLGIQFCRQELIGEAMMEFFAPRARLVIAGDGAEHLEGEHAPKDRRRDRDLVSLGLKVRRFCRREVLEERNAAVEAIDRTVAEQLNAKNPPWPPL